VRYPHGLSSLIVLVAVGCAGSNPPRPRSAVVPEPVAAAAIESFAVRVVGAGRPMILIPGLTCSGDVWSSTVEHFSKGYELHVLTLAGFAGQPAIGGPFLDRVRRDLVRYIRDRKLARPVIVGHSLGGFLGFWIAATEPDAVGAVIAVDGVPFLPALMDPAATADGSRARAAEMRAIMASETPEQFRNQTRRILSGDIKDPKDVDFVVRKAGDSDPAAVGQAVYELMTTDLRPMVKAITSPTLLIAAGDSASDRKSRREVIDRYEDQVKTIPNHRVALATEARHFVMLDDPGFLFAEMDRFLRDFPSGR
jgi:N-formylmaleamate deformylase